MPEPKATTFAPLIIFEGLDGVGKTTQLELAKQALEEAGHKVYATRNLGGTPIGEELRRVMKLPIDRPALSELYMSMAVQEALAPTLAKERKAGHIVLLDRSPISMAVYQGYGDEAPKQLAWQLADHSLKNYKPDLIIIYDCPIDVALKRAKTARPASDYFESKPRAFFERIKEGFSDSQKHYKVNIVDATQGTDAVHAATMDLINDLVKV